MKLFNALALAVVAFGANLVGVAGQEQVPLVTVVVETTIVAPSETAADAEATAALASVDEDMKAEVAAEGGGRRLGTGTGDTAGLQDCELLDPNNYPSIRRRLDFIVVDKCFWDSSSGAVFRSVGVDKSEIPCIGSLANLNLGYEYKYFKYQFSFYAYFLDNGTNNYEVPTWMPPVVVAKIKQLISLHSGWEWGPLEVYYSAVYGPEAVGDPHFKTWSGNWFDFMGECDMKFIHAPHFDGENRPLDIDVRTKIRYDYSYIASAALKLGNDTLEVASYGDYFLNGVAGAAMPAFVGGYPVTHTVPSKKIHVFEITISETEKLVIKAFKDLVAVVVNDLEPKRFSGSLGMAGSFDLNGKMIGRDGETEITDPNAFANEWQIRQDETSLFHVAKGPQHPEQCKLPKVSTSEKRRRLGEGIAREKAERACAHFIGEHFENCVFDVMAVGDIEIAQAGAY